MGLLIPVLLFLIFPDLGLAPPLPTRQTEAPASSLIEPSTNTASSPTSEPPAAAEPKEDEDVRKPVVETVRRATLPAALTPARHGLTEGPLWIGQRSLVEDYVGWGWIRRESEGWNQARWIAAGSCLRLRILPSQEILRPKAPHSPSRAKRPGR